MIKVSQPNLFAGDRGIIVGKSIIEGQVTYDVELWLFNKIITFYDHHHLDLIQSISGGYYGTVI